MNGCSATASARIRSPRGAPVQVGVPLDWTLVSVGDSHTCGVRNGGELHCWGMNEAGQIGDGTAWSTTPVLVQ